MSLFCSRYPREYSGRKYPKDQRELLERGRIHIRQIGFNVGRRGMKDEDEIILFLLKQHHPTFFTRDDDFYKPRLCHAKYGLIYLAVEKNEVASFVRRLLHHPEFDTQAKRMGAVIRVSSARLTRWRLRVNKLMRVEWE